MVTLIVSEMVSLMASLLVMWLFPIYLLIYLFGLVGGVCDKEVAPPPTQAGAQDPRPHDGRGVGTPSCTRGGDNTPMMGVWGVEGGWTPQPTPPRPQGGGDAPLTMVWVWSGLDRPPSSVYI